MFQSLVIWSPPAVSIYQTDLSQFPIVFMEASQIKAEDLQGVFFLKEK